MLTITRGRFRAGANRWVVTGTTTWFSAAVTTSTVSCPVATRPCPTTTIIIPIGTGLVDGLGGFTVDVSGATEAPTNTNFVSITCTSTYGAAATTTATRLN